MGHAPDAIELCKEVCNQMVEIHSGSVEMRDDRTKVEWVANVEPFYISRFLITQKLYEQVVGENPSHFFGENLPVESVSWLEAITFCNKLSLLCGFQTCYTILSEPEDIVFNSAASGFRLPFEAEWMFACMAGTKSIRYSDVNAIAWYKSNSGKHTHEVGCLQPNSWGIYDMLGNVWEWCNDIYDETVYGTYRIFKGGGWNDEERSVMVTTRRRSHPLKFKIDDLGFRIARNKV